MKRILGLGTMILIMLFVGKVDGFGQADEVWKTLSKITYKKEYNELLGFKVDMPVFSEPILSLNEKEIQIRGYMIPVEGYNMQDEFILSAYPYNMCFFCGGAGPETVMEVYAKDKVKYTTEPIVIKGKLALNDDDINALMYKLTDAEIIEME